MRVPPKEGGRGKSRSRRRRRLPATERQNMLRTTKNGADAVFLFFSCCPPPLSLSSFQSSHSLTSVVIRHRVVPTGGAEDPEEHGASLLPVDAGAGSGATLSGGVSPARGVCAVDAVCLPPTVAGRGRGAPGRPHRGGGRGEDLKY